jgi:hypothetical protein
LANNGGIEMTISYEGQDKVITVFPDPNNGVAEFVCLAVSDNQGLGQILGADNFTVTVQDHANNAGVIDDETVISIESLNLRDIGAA